MVVVERVAAFLFADLAGFTALTEAHGNLGAADVAERFYELAQGSLLGDGRIVKTIGDAVMIVASDTVSAVQIALRLTATVGREPNFPMLRSGLDSGPAIERRGDFIGGSVNLAARVAAYARSGQVLGTEVVARAAEAREVARVVALGRAALKNIAEPVELFQLLGPECADPNLVVDPVCRMCVSPESAAAQVTFGGRTYFFCSPTCAHTFEANLGRYGTPK